MDTVLQSGLLRVVFLRRQDRWAHTIGLVEQGQFRPLLESIEGRPEDEWPCSPPFQELQIEERGDGNVALLVGQTPKCHWSMSVEAESKKSALRFDVACRVPTQDALGTLSSTYQSLVGKPKVLSGNGNANRAPWLWSGQIVMQAERGSSLWPAADGGVTVEADPEEFTFPATFRWQYAICDRVP